MKVGWNLAVPPPTASVHELFHSVLPIGLLVLMSDSTPTRDEIPFREVLRRLADLHEATAERSFATSLTHLLEGSGIESRTTLFGRRGSEWHLLASNFSTTLDQQTKKLLAPRVESQTLGQALGVTSGFRTLETPSTLTVDRQDLPVTAHWVAGDDQGNELVLLFHDSVESQLDGDDEDSFVSLVDRHLEVAYARLRQAGAQHVELDLLRAKLEAINEIGELLGSLDLEILLTKLMELSLYVVGGQIGSIVLHRDSEADDGVVENAIEWGLPLEVAERVVDPDGRSLFAASMADGETRMIEAFDEESGWQYQGEGAMESYLCVPLISKNGPLGAVNLINCHASGVDAEVLTTICSLAATSVENALLYEAALEKERYAETLKIARDIQKKLYPETHPDLDWMEFAAVTESCDETGGDYYDYIESPGGVTVVVGDVSGHGIGAALHMVAARSALRATIDGGTDITSVVGRMNDQLEHDMDIDQFMTLFLGRFEKGRPLVYVNAGHDSPVIYRKKTGTIEELEATGIPVGLFEGHVYGLGQCPALEPGDVILATTDGVWEVYDKAGEQLFGRARLESCFREFCEQSDSADAIAHGILDRVNAYTGGRPARDDVTILVLRAREEA